MIDRNELKRLIEMSRHALARSFDQIAMETEDLILQAEKAAHLVAHSSIVFVGDYDLASVALVAIAKNTSMLPKRVHVVDFDNRVLDSVKLCFSKLGVDDLLAVTCYNVFDPVPAQLQKQFDWFYANPPYGKFNDAMSVKLFCHRGIEMVGIAGKGLVIIPNDPSRAWTQSNVQKLKAFGQSVNWEITERTDVQHGYSLDDDPDLKSTTFTLEPVTLGIANLPWQGLTIPHSSMSAFYGRSVSPPFPAEINLDGEVIYRANDLLEQAS